MKRPNILFLMSDQHRADVTGYAGNNVIRAPVLDRMARTGVVKFRAWFKIRGQRSVVEAACRRFPRGWKPRLLCRPRCRL